jgi:hypothetical protein
MMCHDVMKPYFAMKRYFPANLFTSHTIINIVDRRTYPSIMNTTFSLHSLYSICILQRSLARSLTLSIHPSIISSFLRKAQWYHPLFCPFAQKMHKSLLSVVIWGPPLRWAGRGLREEVIERQRKEKTEKQKVQPNPHNAMFIQAQTARTSHVLIIQQLISNRGMAVHSWCASCPARAGCGQSRITHAVAVVADGCAAVAATRDGQGGI